LRNKKIDNLGKEAKVYLDRIEEAYKNSDLNNADYEELCSAALNILEPQLEQLSEAQSGLLLEQELALVVAGCLIRFMIIKRGYLRGLRIW